MTIEKKILLLLTKEMIGNLTLKIMMMKLKIKKIAEKNMSVTQRKKAKLNRILQNKKKKIYKQYQMNPNTIDKIILNTQRILTPLTKIINLKKRNKLNKSKNKNMLNKSRNKNMLNKSRNRKSPTKKKRITPTLIFDTSQSLDIRNTTRNVTTF